MSYPSAPLQVSIATFLLAFLWGCAEIVRVPLVYEPPPQKASSGCLIVAFAPIVDERKDFEIDKYIADYLPQAVGSNAETELESIDVVHSVISSNAGRGSERPADITVGLSLVATSEAIPHRGGRMAGMLGGAMALGIIGETLAGRGDTSVHSEVELGLRIEYPKQQLVLTRRLLGKAIYKVPALYMDTPQTKSRVFGMALKQALTQMKQIIVQHVKLCPTN